MIHMKVDGLPPSANHAYITIMKGKGRSARPIRVLSTEGKKYKRETSAALVRNFPTELKVFIPNVPFAVVAQFHFSNLYNKGWPDKAQSRYKKIDVDNRLKLFMDALKDATGVDDSNYLDIRAQKVEGPEETHIWAWNMEEECPQDMR
jgi:Holliday junction resolvase RusA-like endonuclease